MDKGQYEDQVLDSKLRSDAGNILARYGTLAAVETEFTPEKIEWLWNEMQKYRTLFSDFTRGNVGNFISIVTDPYSYWVSVVEEGLNVESDKLIGIIYLNNLNQLIDADIHMMFFDRKPAEKLEITKQIIRHFFSKFIGLQRVTATLPAIYYATLRLATKTGFTKEGTKRSSLMMGSKLVDEVIFGLLASEVI